MFDDHVGVIMQSGDQLLQLFDDHLEVIINPCDYVCDYAQAIGSVVTTKKLIIAKYSGFLKTREL